MTIRLMSAGTGISHSEHNRDTSRRNNTMDATTRYVVERQRSEWSASPATPANNGARPRKDIPR
jgi:redox-sensitive bicupin YhaK (pirin superfamily)